MKPIGIIRTEFQTKDNIPIQGRLFKHKGKIEVFPEYQEGLKDLDGFSHIILIYKFHKSKGYKLRVKPFLENREKGVFATRAPRRPNPIGLTIVKLIKITDNIIEVEGVDMLDKTPLLDIKPYVPQFDHEDIKIGWLKDKFVSDSRFG
ncbi:tRNA (N6-threonylcarbamoyladenosine(37)-N6)-methyltransferase TrmO [Candidatus Woesearchaeota archaeon]|nr:tRNA (N6-threonylcarbamoyladenosine(37)-N6)-methyltransferase TrmO [Candidatus Woesearchaeota archaeon]